MTTTTTLCLSPRPFLYTFVINLYSLERASADMLLSTDVVFVMVAVVL